MATKNFLISDWHNNVDHQDIGDGLGTFSGGNTNDTHFPISFVYETGGGLYTFHGFMKFANDFADVITVTSAKLWLKTTTGTHVPTQAEEFAVERVTSAWTGNGGSEGNWSGAYRTPSATSSGRATKVPTTADSTWMSITITTIVQAWLAGSANDGLRVGYPISGISTSGKATEVYSGDATSANRPYIEVTYTTNTLPSAPTLSAPAAGYRDTTVGAGLTFDFSHNDADGDACASYDIQVSTDSTFASLTHWNGSNLVSGIVDDEVTVAYGGSALTRGVTYYWRARTNDGTGDGTWATARSFVVNALPTATKDSPASAALGTIHNITDLAIWTGAGTNAKPRFKFTPDDADNDNLTKYRLKVWNDNAGVKGTLLYDSGIVVQAMPHDVQVTVDFASGLVNGTQYWWSLAVYDGYEWSDGTSDGSTGDTATKFKLRWAQGMFEQDTTSASSTNWAMATGTIVQTASLLFSSSTGAARTGTTEAWYTVMSSVPKHRYMQVLVRLTTATAGTGATLADATFTYYATPSTPDGWTAA